MLKDSKKKFERTLVRWVFYFFSWLFRILPYAAIKAMTGGLLAIIYFVLQRQRRAAMSTLSIAFGKEKSQEELGRICKDCFYNAGRGAIEIGAFTARPALIKETFSFEGNSRENLDAAFKEGCGVIGISAHFGNRTIGVSVVHEPAIATLDNSNESIGADTACAVADGRHLGR